MGSACSRMDSIEHAQNKEDIRNIIISDSNLFNLQLDILKKDKCLNDVTKRKKIEYFDFIITKLSQYSDFLYRQKSMKVI